METERLRVRWRAGKVSRYPFYGVAFAAGLALLWWPFHTQRELDRWSLELREHGVPAEAVVYQRVTKDAGRASPSETMHVRYTVAGRTRTGEIGCWEACLPPTTPVRIWVNAADPTDFAAEFGTLSGNRGRAQGVAGAAGFVLALLSGAAIVGRMVAAKRARRRRLAKETQLRLRRERQDAEGARRRSGLGRSAKRPRKPRRRQRA